MTYPGLPGQIGPPPTSTVGWQVRQSRAGAYPGGNGTTYTTVIDTMDGYASALAVAASKVTVIGERSAFPFPISADNFQLPGWRNDRLDGTASLLLAVDNLDGTSTAASSVAVDRLDRTALGTDTAK